MSQDKLSSFGAGDQSDLDLSVGSYADRQQTEEYARSVTGGGWELLSVTDSFLGWWNPDGDGVYTLEKKGHGWVGEHGTKRVEPLGVHDLQEAVDVAGSYLCENPIE